MSVAFVAATVTGGWAAMNGQNDDRWRAEPTLGAFAVADASGPRYGGYHAPYAVDPALDALFAALASGAALHDAVRRADEVARGLRERPLGHCTTSLTAAVVDATSATIAQVGSGRAYRVRGEATELVARDHCPFPPPHEEVVTSLLGFGELQLELVEVELAVGDRLVLCTDGAWRCGDDVVRALCERLDDTLREAAARRRDSATAIVITIG